MSTFAKVLQRAARERLLQSEALRGQDSTSEEGSNPQVLAREPALPTSRLDTELGASPAAPREATARAVERVDRHLVSLLHPASLVAESYRALRLQIEQIHRASSGSTVLAVSSAAVGDGKTTTSINLAGALAQAPDARVLLVDADLRNPSIARHLALGTSGPGLVDAILDASLPLDRVVQSRPPFNLDVLAAGTPPTTPYEVLKSSRLGDLLEEARRRYDYVLLDTAPLTPVPDCQLISKWIDGLLLVVAAHKTPRRLFAEALNQLDPEKLVGLVFNEDAGALAPGYGYPRYGTAADAPRVPAWRLRLGRWTGVARV